MADVVFSGPERDTRKGFSSQEPRHHVPETSEIEFSALRRAQVRAGVRGYAPRFRCVVVVSIITEPGYT